MLGGAHTGSARTLLGLVFVWLFGSALALGCAPYWLAFAVLGLIVFSASFVFGELRRGWSSLSTVLLGLALFSGVQVIPMPLPLLGPVSPAAASYWSDAARIPGLSGPIRYGSLSLDPGATALEVLKWSTYAIVSAAAGRLSKLFGVSAMLSVTGALGSLLSVIGLGHVLVSAERVFGIYAPITGRTVIGPLINPNHFAAYANLAAFCCAGLALSSSRSRVRVAAGCAVALNVLACFVSASRGGVLTLLLGFGALVLWVGLTRRQETSRLGAGPLLGLFGVLVGLGGFSLTGARSHELLDRDLSKLALLPRAFDAAGDFPLFGVGRGAFDSVAFRYFPDLGAVVLRSVESFPVSFLVEWGAPVTVIALVLFALVLWPGRAVKNIRRTAAWIGICAVLVQNLADIGLELPSLSLAFWALAGALKEGRQDGSSRRDVLRTFDPGGAVGFALGLAALGALLAYFMGPNAFERRRALHAQYVARDPGFSRQALASMLASPADPYFPFLAGVDAAERGEDALGFGALALRRAPGYGRGHFLVGRALLARGAREQAIMEFRLAMQEDRALIVDGVRAGMMAAQTASQFERLVPSGANRSSVLFELFRDLPEGRWPALRRRFLREANALSPENSSISAALLFELTSDLRRGTVPCSERIEGRCPLVEAERVRSELDRGLAQLARREPASCATARVRAQLLEIDGRVRDGEQLLARECSTCLEPAVCIKDRLALADRIGDARLIEAAELTFRAMSCDSTDACAHSEEYLADRARARGELAAAAQHLFNAASQSPSPNRWFATARAYLAARSVSRAGAAYERARELGATDAALEKEISALRRDSLRDLLQKDRPHGTTPLEPQ